MAANQQEMTLQAIAGERLFEVPDYQRPFAWGEKQLQDLWDDLDQMASNRHYAGTLVLRVHDGEPAFASGRSLTLNDVVDGQQRLTTCFLLLDRLRLFLEQIDDDEAREASRTIQETYGFITIDSVPRPKLRLANELRDYWERTILGGHPAGERELIAGQRRLRDAQAFFDERLSELVEGVDPQTALNRLKKLNFRIVAGLKFMLYEIGDHADVGVIFETLNERGRPLSEMEKIKNYLLYLARTLPDGRRDHLVDKVNKSWAVIFRNLARVPGNQEDRVLRAHWLATKDSRLRQWARTATIKAHFPRSRYLPASLSLQGDHGADSLGDDQFDELVRDVTTYVDTLQQCSLFTAELHAQNPGFVDFQAPQGIVEAHQSLRRTGVLAFFYPLLFATRLRHPKDAALYIDVLWLCETYAARVFLIDQRRSNTGQQWLTHIAHEIFTGQNPDEAKAEIAAATWHYADDDRVRNVLQSPENWYARRGHKYFLYEYERHLLRGSAKSTVLPFETFTGTAHAATTEHILPQNPGPESAWWDDFTPDEHERLRHTLGNLMLTHENSVYSNYDYIVKRGESDQTQPACYYNGAMAQEREVARTYPDWTPQSIQERQRILADWAMTRWPVQPPEAGAIAHIEDELGDEAIEDEGEEDE